MKILITGGSSGLGKRIVEILSMSKENFITSTYYKNKPTNHKKNVNYHKINFSNDQELSDFLSTIALMNFDVLINNFFNLPKKLHAHKANKFDLVSGFKNNVSSTLLISNQMISNFRLKRSGKIINVLTDYLKSQPPLGLSLYYSEKKYIEAYMDCIKNESKNFDIKIHNIYPKTMITNFTKDLSSEVISRLKENNEMVDVDSVAKQITWHLTH